MQFPPADCGDMPVNSAGGPFGEEEIQMNPLLTSSALRVSILRFASTHFAEYFGQLLAPSIDISQCNEVTRLQGMALRLVRDGRATPENGNAGARARRLDQLQSAAAALRILP
jgi:hypothetical protein